MEGFITWYSEFKSWGIFIVDENFNYIVEPEYFAYKKEALSHKEDLNKEYFNVKWEIGKRN